VFSKVLFREVRGKGFFALEWTSFLSTNNTKKFNEEKFHELLLSRMSWGVRVVFSKVVFRADSWTMIGQKARLNFPFVILHSYCRRQLKIRN
jgi:hypothetical protein